MAVVSPDFSDPEREFLEDMMIDEVNSLGLRVAFIYFKSPHSGCIVDGGILEPACLLTGFSYESQELDVHLDVMCQLQSKKGALSRGKMGSLRLSLLRALARVLPR